MPWGYLAKQRAARRDAIRDACFEIPGKPTGAFSLPAQVICVRGLVP